MFLLDTDTCIFLAKGYVRAVERLAEEGPSTVFVSSISYHELLYGALHSAAVEKHLRRVEILTEPLTILPFTKRTSERSSGIKQELAAIGMQIGPLDTLIAGHALEHGLTLVTGNSREFKRVPNLRLEDWVNNYD